MSLAHLPPLRVLRQLSDAAKGALIGALWRQLDAASTAVALVGPGIAHQRPGLIMAAGRDGKSPPATAGPQDSERRQRHRGNAVTSPRKIGDTRPSQSLRERMFFYCSYNSDAPMSPTSCDTGLKGISLQSNYVFQD